MTPLVFMLWAPQFHYPWSGAVSQDIDPDLNWFAREIRPGAGDARVERRAFRVASYGTQLGLITDVLLEQLDHAGAPDTPALRELRQLRERIAAIKDDEYDGGGYGGRGAAVHAGIEEALVERVQAARGRDDGRLAALAQRLLPLLAETAETAERAR